MTRRRGFLFDQLVGPSGEPVKSTETHLNSLSAALRSKDGKTILASLNQLVVGYVPPMSEFTDHDSSGALIALEACRNFVRELETIAVYDERAAKRHGARPAGGATERP